MARLTLGQKATRVLDFLLGLRNARIAAWLKPYGFDQPVLHEGWSLLRAVGKTQLDSDPEQPSYDPDTLGVLDKWENKWFTISDATLARHAPDVHKWFFKAFRRMFTGRSRLAGLAPPSGRTQAAGPCGAFWTCLRRPVFRTNGAL